MTIFLRGALASSLVVMFGGDLVRADPALYQRLLASSAWLVTPREKGPSVGTAWVVERERRLVVTAAHVVLDSPEVLVYFPRHLKEELIVDSSDYLRHAAPVMGRVLTTDKDRDLALVQLESLPADIRELKLAPQSARPGESVHSLGNSGAAKHLADGSLWRYTRGHVRQIAERKAGPLGTRRIRMLETQAPVNVGDSGGPLVNERGEVVGVVSFYQSDEQLVTYNVDLRELRTFLDNHLANISKNPVARKDIVGTWTLRTQDAKGNTASAVIDFQRDGNYTITPEGEMDEDNPPQHGRFTLANSMMWWITEDDIAALNVTSLERNQFSAQVNGVVFRFERKRE